MTAKFGRLVKLVSPILLLASVFVGNIAPAQAADDKMTIRLQGIDNTNAYERTVDETGFLQYGYQAGLRVFTKHLPVGSTTELKYQVTLGGVPQANQTVTLHLNKAWSGSTANITVGETTANGLPYVDCGGWWGQCSDAATLTAVTNVDGLVTFSMKNNNIASEAADYPASATSDFTGTHLFSQITANVGSDSTDIEDIVDFVFHKPQGAVEVPRTTPAVLVNFESSDSSGYSITPFGNVTSVLDTGAPDGGSIGSVNALRIMDQGDCWAGTTFLKRAIKESLLSVAHPVVKANIYAPAAGKVIKLKLENITDNTLNKEVDVTSVAGWNTYSFDFTGFNADVDYNVASIFVNFTCGNSNVKSGEGWGVDDIAFNGAAGAALAGAVTPVDYTGNATIRLVGLSDTNSFNRPDDAGFFVSQGWYRAGLRTITKQVPVGSTQSLTWLVTDSDGKALPHVNVHFVIGKEYSGSNAKVSVGSVSSTGNQQIIDGFTGSDGTVTFQLANSDVAADAADNPGANLGANYSGKHLFTQVSVWTTGQNQDSIDLIDLVYHKPADAPVVPTIVTRVTGINADNAFVGTCEGWCQYYAAGLRYFERGVQVGSTTSMSFTVTDTDGNPYANKTVHLLLGKTYSGSSAKVSVNGVAFSGSGNEKVVDLTTNANGVVTFDVVNSNFNADADPHQAANLEHPKGGKHLFAQLALVGEKGNQDVLDIIDLVYYQAEGAGPATTYNVRLADWSAANSFDGTHVWGDGGLGSWFDETTRYFAHYVAAGSTFNLRYKVTNAATGANAPDGTVVTLSLGAAWSGSNAKFSVAGTSVNGLTKWGGNGQLDQATVTATVSGGYISVPMTALDDALDATANPSNPKANPDTLNPLFMQVKTKVEGNAITRQDWVNIVVTGPAEAPSITAISTTAGKKGQAIDIVGTHLGDALGSTVVLHTPATTKTAAINTAVTVVSVSADGTRLTVLSPAVTQKGYFKVTNTGGTSIASKSFSASSSTTVKPTVTLTSSLVKEVGSTFTLSGSNIASASVIAIGGVSVPFRVLTASSVEITVPQGVVSGSTISVTNAGGTTTTSKFIYQAAVISQMTASAKVGQTVTVSGANLKASKVVFGGNKTAKILTNTGSSLTFTVPTGATTGAIKITTGAGTISTDSFTVVPPTPTITSFTPTLGKKGSTLVTVRGANLLNATVTIGSVQATVAAGSSSSSLKFVIPANASTGKITITTPGGSVTSSANLTVN